MKACPCRNCDNKGCGAYHDICEKYLEYKKAKDDYREKDQARREEDARMLSRKRRPWTQ